MKGRIDYREAAEGNLGDDRIILSGIAVIETLLNAFVKLTELSTTESEFNV